MSARAGSAAPQELLRDLASPRVRWLASLVFCGLLPVLTVAILFTTAVRDDDVAFDFRPFYTAGEEILAGEDPYPDADDPLTASGAPYVYPPLPALLSIPLTPLSQEAAGVLVMLLLVAAAMATLLALDVRDWRCYGAAFLWPPVLSAIQTGNVTLLLGLAAALAWRFRDRMWASSAAIGVTLAVKFVLWPLVVWLAATRRVASAVLACVLGTALLAASWGALGYAGLAEYPDLLRRLDETVGDDSYTLHVVLLDVGVPSGAARAAWLAVGLAVLAALLVVARRGDDRRAFLLAVAASLALTPIVWLHYFALLLVAVAVARPQLGLVWFVPLTMLFASGSGDATMFQRLLTLAAAALTLLVALRASPEPRRVGERPRADGLARRAVS